MTDIGYLKSRIMEFMRENGLSPDAFAERAGVTPDLLIGAGHTDWDPRVSTLDRCLRIIDEDASTLPESHEPVEQELPWRVIKQDNYRALRECASIWSTLGRERFLDVFELLSRHELAHRIVVIRMKDNHQLFLDRFNPMTWGESRHFEGSPLSELPDKRVGQWAEQSLAQDYKINQPRLIACRIPTETLAGRYVVPYTALRLPFGNDETTQELSMSVTLLKNGSYKDVRDALDGPDPSPPPTRGGHLRLVKS
jgi:hypothetical protein